MQDDPVIAVLCSDLHLSAKAPVARRGEADWFAAMARSLAPLKEYDSLFSGMGNQPAIICAGDIFDKSNSSPELINFAIRALPSMWTICGQHDLLHHQLDQVHKSAYHTLELCDRIRTIETPTLVSFAEPTIVLWGFPWGAELRPLAEMQVGSGVDLEDCLNIAVVHKYIWQSKANCYPGAPPEGQINRIREDLAGFDVAVFGDNHIGFLADGPKPIILNCGGFMRRAADQIDYRPAIGLLHASGRVTRELLPIDEDIIEAVGESKTLDAPDFSEFFEELAKLGADPLDFVAMVTAAAEKEEKSVQEVLMETVDHIRAAGD